MQTKIYLIRHAEVHNPGNVHYGRMPGFSLSEKGRSQARETGRFLKQFNISAIYSSPLERAVETSEELKNELEVPVILMDELLEVHSKWDGVSREEMEKKNWNLFEHPEGVLESLEDFFNRVYGVFLQIDKKHEGESVAIVAHGDSVMIPKSKLEGIPFNKIHQSDVYADYVSFVQVHEVLIDGDKFSMKSIFTPKQ